MYIYRLFISILWPFIGIFSAFKHIDQRQFRWLILFFILIASFTIIPYEQGDIRLYQQVFDELNFLQPHQTVLDLIVNSISLKESRFELFVPLNVLIVSRFTDNIAFSYLLTALIFYWIWIKIIKELVFDFYKESENSSKLLLYLLISFSIYVIFFRAINGRFYLAYWLSIMSIYFIIYKKKYSYYIFLVSSVFIHQSYVFLVGLFLFFQLIGFVRKFKKFDEILIVLFILGIVYSEFSVSFISENVLNKMGAFNDNYDNYVKDSYVEAQSSRDRKWFLNYRSSLLFFSCYTLLLRLKYSKKIEITKVNHNLLQFVLLFAAINAFTFNIPSFGERFRNVLIGFLLLLIFKIYINNKTVVFKSHLKILLLVFVFYKIVTFRVFADYINLYSYMPTPLLFNWFDPEGFSLLDLISPNGSD